MGKSEKKQVIEEGKAQIGKLHLIPADWHPNIHRKKNK